MGVTLSRVHHIGIIVKDLDKTIAFYNKLFGMEPDIRTEVNNSPGMAAQFGVDSVDAKLAFYDVDNTSIEFIEVVQPKESLEQLKVYVPGAKHLCFQVDNAEEVYQEMRSAGYKFEAPVVHYDEKQPKLKGINWAYFTDPDGNILEIMEDPNKQGLKGLAQKVGLANG